MKKNSLLISSFWHALIDYKLVEIVDNLYKYCLMFDISKMLKSAW